jgi:hypothetical protein
MFYSYDLCISPHYNSDEDTTVFPSASAAPDLLTWTCYQLHHPSLEHLVLGTRTNKFASSIALVNIGLIPTDSFARCGFFSPASS